MSARRVIVIGDKTTHGGTVLQGSQTMTAGAKVSPDKGIWFRVPNAKVTSRLLKARP